MESMKRTDTRRGGRSGMPRVGIVMGSDSDLKVMSKAAAMLEKLGFDY